MRVAFLIVVMAVCFSCKKQEGEAAFDSRFYFTQMQPMGKDSLEEAPASFLGAYVNDTNDTLYLRNSVAYYMKFEKSAIAKDSLKVLSKGKYLSLKARLQSLDPEIVLTAEDNDSVYIKYPVRDTLFNLANKQSATRFRGHFIVHTKDSVYWHVAAYSVKKDSLYIKRFLDTADLGIVKSVVKDVQVNADTTKVIVNPTKREFKRLLKSHAGTVQGFRKIS